MEGQAGLEIAPRWVVGAYLAAGGGSFARAVDRSCDRFAGSCMGRTLRAGLLARRDVSPDEDANPWLALGAGVQRHRTGLAFIAVADPEIVLTGPELRLMAGVDWRVARTAGIGLFAALSVGEYLDVTFDGEPLRGSSPITTWLTIGARGVLLP